VPRAITSSRPRSRRRPVTPVSRRGPTSVVPHHKPLSQFPVSAATAGSRAHLPGRCRQARPCVATMSLARPRHRDAAPMGRLREADVDARIEALRSSCFSESRSRTASTTNSRTATPCSTPQAPFAAAPLAVARLDELFDFRVETGRATSTADQLDGGNVIHRRGLQRRDLPLAFHLGGLHSATR